MQPSSIKRSFADALFCWGRKLAKKNPLDVPAQEPRGSLSYRHGLGFVITSPASSLNRLSDRDLQFIETLDPQLGSAATGGRTPLTETHFCHALVYRSRGGIIFIFHVAGPQIEETAVKAGWPLVDCPPSTSNPVFQEKFAAQLGRGNTIAIRGGGVWSLACTAEDAGEQLMDLLSADFPQAS